MGETRNPGNGSGQRSGNQRERRFPTKDGITRLNAWVQRSTELAGVMQPPKVVPKVNGDDGRGYFYDVGVTFGGGPYKRAEVFAEAMRGPVFFLARALDFRDTDIVLQPVTDERVQEIADWVKDGLEILARGAALTLTHEVTKGEQGFGLYFTATCEKVGRLISYGRDEGGRGAIIRAFRELVKFVAKANGFIEADLDTKGADEVRNRFAESTTGGTLQPPETEAEADDSGDSTPTSADA